MRYRTHQCAGRVAKIAHQYIFRAPERGLNCSTATLFLFFNGRLSVTEDTNIMDTKKFWGSHSVPEETMSGNYSEARAIMKFLHEVERLKRLARSGWQLKKIPDPESVADHSHRLTIMACFAEVFQSYQFIIYLKTIIGASRCKKDYANGGGARPRRNSSRRLHAA